MSQLLLSSRPSRFTRRSAAAAGRAPSAGVNRRVDDLLRELALVYRLTEQVKAAIHAADGATSAAA